MNAHFTKKNLILAITILLSVLAVEHFFFTKSLIETASYFTFLFNCFIIIGYISVITLWTLFYLNTNNDD